MKMNCGFSKWTEFIEPREFFRNKVATKELFFSSLLKNHKCWKKSSIRWSKLSAEISKCKKSALWQEVRYAPSHYKDAKKELEFLHLDAKLEIWFIANQSFVTNFSPHVLLLKEHQVRFTLTKIGHKMMKVKIYIRCVKSATKSLSKARRMFKIETLEGTNWNCMVDQVPIKRYLQLHQTTEIRF